jgi:hypothetical protein
LRFKVGQRKRTPATHSQLELRIGREYELDRNFSKGGRSFYFFDFDDNIAILTTPIFVFHKDTGIELSLTSREFSEASRFIGHVGPYKDYEVRFDDDLGSFRAFRDRDLSALDRMMGKKQPFVEDLLAALGLPDYSWKGPSWDCFFHAVFNQRPIAMITARGHHPDTIKNGIDLMIEKGHLPHQPNYLALYPINFPPIKEKLRKKNESTVAEMKQAAIRASVEMAFHQYGYNPHHRFGMSDDDPRNLELIIEEMSRLKADYPELSFFVFDTHKGYVLKREIFRDHTEDQPVEKPDQLPLF